MKKLSKKETEKRINNFFSDLWSKTPSEIRKIKKLAMNQNIKLGDKKKMFCKKCLSPYKSPKVRVINKRKIVECENCGYVSRWGLKT